jgi:hypothetical protein
MGCSSDVCASSESLAQEVIGVAWLLGLARDFGF